MNGSTMLAAALAGIGVIGCAPARAAGAPIEPAQASSCPAPAPRPASEADLTLSRGQFDDALRLFAAMPVSDESLAGQVRALIGQGQFSPALPLALRAAGEHPQDAVLVDALGAARLGRGEPAETLATLHRAVALDPCLARTHYDLGRYLAASGMLASAQRELDLAHRLQPGDPLIRLAWKATQQPVPTPDSEIADLRAIEVRPTETAAQKAQIESLIKQFEAEKRGDCELVSSAVTRVPLLPQFVDGKRMPPTGSMIEVVMNGKTRRLLLDTGATGVIISKEAAKGLGLVPEAGVTSAGVGDDGASAEFLAHLDSLKVGDLEFRNCLVRVQTQAQGLDVQGLFGLDTLQGVLLTLDLPHQELSSAALPPLAGPLAPYRTIAESRQDRYLPAGMTDWIPAFREERSLLVPVSIGTGPSKLFVLDTGTQAGMIATDVAREVTTVTPHPADSLRGVSGVTRGVSAAGPMTIAFGDFTGRVEEMSALADLSGFAPRGDMRVSGFVGYDILRHLVLAIDYRDGLISATKETR